MYKVVVIKSGYGVSERVKSRPHNAVMHSCEGVFVIHCNCLKLQELLYGENSNMFENVFPILKCLGYFLFDFQI